MAEYAPAAEQPAAAEDPSLFEELSEFEKRGFRSTFGEFNVELLRPFKRFDGGSDSDGIPQTWRGALRCCTSTCQNLCGNILTSLPNPFVPSNEASRKAKFVLWNVLCFWIGVVDLVVIFALKSELHSGWAWVIALFDGFLGYLFAYTFYFIFVLYGKQRWMLGGLAIVAAYVLGTAYLTYEGTNGPGTHIEMTEGVLNGCKALANMIVLYHGAKIVWKEQSAQLHHGAAPARPRDPPRTRPHTQGSHRAWPWQWAVIIWAQGACGCPSWRRHRRPCTRRRRSERPPEGSQRPWCSAHLSRAHQSVVERVGRRTSIIGHCGTSSSSKGRWYVVLVGRTCRQ